MEKRRQVTKAHPTDSMSTAEVHSSNMRTGRRGSVEHGEYDEVQAQFIAVQGALARLRAKLCAVHTALGVPLPPPFRDDDIDLVDTPSVAQIRQYIQVFSQKCEVLSEKLEAVQTIIEDEEDNADKDITQDRGSNSPLMLLRQTSRPKRAWHGNSGRQFSEVDFQVFCSLTSVCRTLTTRFSHHVIGPRMAQVISRPGFIRDSMCVYTSGVSRHRSQFNVTAHSGALSLGVGYLAVFQDSIEFVMVGEADREEILSSLSQPSKSSPGDGENGGGGSADATPSGASRRRRRRSSIGMGGQVLRVPFKQLVSVELCPFPPVAWSHSSGKVDPSSTTPSARSRSLHKRGHTLVDSQLSRSPSVPVRSFGSSRDRGSPKSREKADRNSTRNNHSPALHSQNRENPDSISQSNASAPTSSTASASSTSSTSGALFNDGHESPWTALEMTMVSGAMHLFWAMDDAEELTRVVQQLSRAEISRSLSAVSLSSPQQQRGAPKHSLHALAAAQHDLFPTTSQFVADDGKADGSSISPASDVSTINGVDPSARGLPTAWSDPSANTSWLYQIDALMKECCVDMRQILEPWSGKWKVVPQSTATDFEVYMRPVKGSHVIHRAVAIFNVAPAVVFGAFHFSDVRQVWDTQLESMRVLQVIDEHTDVCYVENVGSFIAKGRDFIDVRRWFQLADGSLLLVYRSADELVNEEAFGDKAIPKKKCIRGRNLGCGFLIEPLVLDESSQNDSLEEEEGDEDSFSFKINAIARRTLRAKSCRVTMLVQTEAKGWVPQSVVDTALSKSLMRQYLEQLGGFLQHSSNVDKLTRMLSHGGSADL